MMKGMVSRWDKPATFVSLQILRSIDLQRLTLLVLLECVPVCEAFALIKATFIVFPLVVVKLCVAVISSFLNVEHIADVIAIIITPN